MAKNHSILRFVEVETCSSLSQLQVVMIESLNKNSWIILEFPISFEGWTESNHLPSGLTKQGGPNKCHGQDVGRILQGISIFCDSEWICLPWDLTKA